MSLMALGAGDGSRPLAVLLLLVLLSLVPFVLLMVTSFVKIAVVLSILRTAAGGGQVPPTQIVTGLALLLTAFVMAPTGERIWKQVEPIWQENSNAELLSPAGLGILSRAAVAGADPVRNFLARHAQGRDVDAFVGLAQRLRAGAAGTEVDRRDLLVLAPAFVVSELRRAFEIGFLIFVPFLVIDLVVSSLIATLGLQMLSPSLVSLPLKLLLFVLADGWNLILRGLVGSYA